MSRRYPFYGEDWQQRGYLLPDVYPRNDDPNIASQYVPAPTGTQEAPAAPIAPGQDLYAQSITPPGVRPIVYQRALNSSLFVVDTQATPIQPGNFQCDAIQISVPSTSTNSTFFGYSSAVTPSSGIEVVPGVPYFYSPNNTRELWEIQRLFEAIVAIMGYYVGMADQGSAIPTPGQYMSPRVVMNANNYYLINNTGVQQNVAIMLFNVPEFQ